jgi:hypothetical protein
VAVAGVLVVLTAGCTPRRVHPDGQRAAFQFPSDAFAFPNETIWEYDTDPATGRISWRRRAPRPPFALRCGTMARAARQFWASARFDPAAPAVDEATYARLARAVIATDPRRPSAERVVIPGYPDLRSFSQAHEAVVKDALAGPWQSYLQRGNWRMIFPFRAGQQEEVAQRLLTSLADGWPPIVHVLRYPNLIVNHMVLVYDAEQTPTEIRFHLYDANDASRPVLLTYDCAARAFSLAPTAYFPGGGVKAYDVYRGLVF